MCDNVATQAGFWGWLGDTTPQNVNDGTRRDTAFLGRLLLQLRAAATAEPMRAELSIPTLSFRSIDTYVLRTSVFKGTEFKLGPYDKVRNRDDEVVLTQNTRHFKPCRTPVCAMLGHGGSVLWSRGQCSANGVDIPVRKSQTQKAPTRPAREQWERTLLPMQRR